MNSARWIIVGHPPQAWACQLSACGGGFFHTSLGLAYPAQRGERVFATLINDGSVMGCALGLRTSCRLSRRPAHYYFPTLPALASPSEREPALLALVSELRHQGAATAAFDSFDARWRPGDGIPSGGARERVEHVVSLAANPEEQLRRFHEAHRRKVRRGVRDGWVLTRPTGAEALALLASIDETGAERGRPTVGLRDLPLSAEEDGGASGATVFAAQSGGVSLSGALVGWSRSRAVYVVGGSTVEGYRQAAAVWLHWRIMTELVGRGIKEYNLGGVPASAVNPGERQHGLHRFKAGFGGEEVPCRGARWPLRPLHMRAHGVLRGIAAVLGR